MDKGGAVPDVFIPHRRLVVGVGHADVSLGDQFLCLVRQLFRGHVHRLNCAVPGHGDLMVLAEGTAQITPEASHGQNQAPEPEAAQGLLFKGGQGQTGESAVV